MNKAVLMLGSNVGDGQANLKNAAVLIEQQLGKIIQVSSLYETEPWGNAQQQQFLNQAMIILTELSPEDLMKKIISIEEKSGRVRKIKWEPRVIDIDILFYNNEIISSENLSVPHPGLQERKFVLVPLAELIPDFIHPKLKKSIAQLLVDVKDPLEVHKVLTHLA